MNEFGFQKQKDRQTDLDQIDLIQIASVLQIVDSWKKCIGCGSCTAVCTAGQFSSFNPRRTQMLARQGCYSTLAIEAAKCQLCGKCRLVCPRDVDTRKLMHELKQLQISLLP